jgi:hypothetical protein
MLRQQREQEYGHHCEQEDRAKRAGAQEPSGAVALRLLVRYWRPASLYRWRIGFERRQAEAG